MITSSPQQCDGGMIGSDPRVDGTIHGEQEHLLSGDFEMTDMADLNEDRRTDKGELRVETRDQDEEGTCGGPSGQSEHVEIAALSGERPNEYKVYKRRWFGLMQLVLLNIVVSWDVSISLQWERGISFMSNDLPDISGSHSPPSPTPPQHISPPAPQQSIGSPPPSSSPLSSPLPSPFTSSTRVAPGLPSSAPPSSSLEEIGFATLVPACPPHLLASPCSVKS